VSGSAAAVLGELASSGASVVGLVADEQRRAYLAATGARIAAYSELDERPGLAAGFEHVVVVDPPASERHERLAALPPERGGGFMHRAWGELETRFAMRALEAQLAQRPVLVALYRELREAGPELRGEELRAALRGDGRHPRTPVEAARCFRVLSEIGLLRGRPDRGEGTVGVVSSEGTDLERSAAHRAYSARYQEGLKFLEGRKQS
jgi:hypothetical protein